MQGKYTRSMHTNATRIGFIHVLNFDPQQDLYDEETAYISQATTILQLAKTKGGNGPKKGQFKTLIQVGTNNSIPNPYARELFTLICMKNNVLFCPSQNAQRKEELTKPRRRQIGHLLMDIFDVVNYILKRNYRIITLG